MRGDNRCKEGKEAMSIRTIPITPFHEGYHGKNPVRKRPYYSFPCFCFPFYLEEGDGAVRISGRGFICCEMPASGGKRMVFPLRRQSGGTGLYLQVPRRGGTAFCYMRRKDAEFLEQEFPGRFCIREREADHEYIYDRKEQQELKGKEFLAARKYIHRLTAAHVLEWEPVCSGNLADAVALVSGWKERAEGIGGLEGYGRLRGNACILGRAGRRRDSGTY